MAQIRSNPPQSVLESGLKITNFVKQNDPGKHRLKKCSAMFLIIFNMIVIVIISNHETEQWIYGDLSTI